jgi:flagellar hook-associated protein 2
MIEGLNGLWSGSGIDVAKLARDIAAAERTARTRAPTERRDRASAEAAAVGQARTALEAFSVALAGMDANGTLRRAATTSHPELVRAQRVSGSTSVETTVEVRALAASQASSVVVADADAPLGTGSVTLTVGSQSRAFAITASDTAFALRDAVNAAGLGIAARVVRNGTSGVLQLTGPTGAASAFTISVTPGVSGLSGGFTTDRTARDADLRVDGIALAVPSNSDVRVVPGLALDLRAAAPGTAVTVGLSSDTRPIATALEQTVAAYNELRALADATPSLRPLRRALADAFARADLARFGIATTRDGSLVVDESRLPVAVSADPAALERAMDGPQGLFGRVASLKARFTGANGEYARLQRALSSARDGATREIDRLNANATRLETQLLRRFGDMERTVNAARATQEYLRQQVAAWSARDR